MNIDSAQSLTIPERVVQFLANHRPSAYCDDCLAEALSLKRSQISTVTGTLGLCQEYRRTAEVCKACGRNGKFVIRAQAQ